MAASAQIATLVCTVPDLDAAAVPQVGTQHSVAGTLHSVAQLCMAVDASDRTDSESHSTEGLGTASAADGCSCTAQTRKAEPAAAAAAVVEVGRSHIRTAAAGTAARACTAVETREDRRRGGGNRWQRAQC